MTALRNNTITKIKDYFNRFRGIKSVQRKSKQLENICKSIDTFLPKIKKVVDDGGVLSEVDMRTLKDLNDRYSALLKDLNDEFQKFPH